MYFFVEIYFVYWNIKSYYFKDGNNIWNIKVI